MKKVWYLDLHTNRIGIDQSFSSPWHEPLHIKNFGAQMLRVLEVRLRSSVQTRFAIQSGIGRREKNYRTGLELDNSIHFRKKNLDSESVPEGVGRTGYWGTRKERRVGDMRFRCVISHMCSLHTGAEFLGVFNVIFYNLIHQSWFTINCWVTHIFAKNVDTRQINKYLRC